jgi:formate dehydrogenase major subunit
MHPSDGLRLGLHNHQGVRVSSRRGYLETRVQLTDDVPVGTLAMPYHFHEAPCNRLTNDAQDPISKMPELKACAVRVEPLPPGQAPSVQAGSREVEHASL